MRTLVFLTIVAGLAGPAGLVSHALASEAPVVEYVDVFDNSALLYTDSAHAAVLTVERSAESGVTFEMITTDGEIVQVEHLALTGAVPDHPYVTGWAGVIDGRKVTGTLRSPADPDSYVNDAPTRMLMQFELREVDDEQGDAESRDLEAIEFLPLSITEADATLVATVLFEPVTPSIPSRRDRTAHSVQLTSASDSPGAAWPRPVSICGCNPVGGYPQTACATWFPCNAACPSVPGTNCSWYYFWVWL